MKKIVLFILALCLCFTSFGAAFAETAAAEARTAEKPAAEMTAEELYQAGRDAINAEDYGKAMEYLMPKDGEASAICMQMASAWNQIITGRWSIIIWAYEYCGNETMEVKF